MKHCVEDNEAGSQVSGKEGPDSLVTSAKAEELEVIVRNRPPRCRS